MVTKILFVEGNIGSGKTTFLENIEKYYNSDECQVIYEPVEEWQTIRDSQNKNILDHFYTDMPKYSYAFQSIAFLTRVRSLEKIKPNIKYVFVERSIFSDKEVFAKNCFHTNMMTEIEWKLYQTWFTWMEKKLDIKADSHIYLQCDPEISYERARNRNRNEEASIPQTYLNDLHQRHNDWLLNNKTKTITVDATTNFNTSKEQFTSMMNHIFENV